MNAIERIFEAIRQNREQARIQDQKLEEARFNELRGLGVPVEELMTNPQKYGLTQYGQQLAASFFVTPQERAEADMLYNMGNPVDIDILQPRKPNVEAIMQQLNTAQRNDINKGI